MLIVLACPACLDARPRETRELRDPVACLDCGALFVYSPALEILVLRCGKCGHTYQRMEVVVPFGGLPACPKCGA